MKYAVGYHVDERFLDLICRQAEQIDEVYFAWEGMPNGRASSREAGQCGAEILLPHLARMADKGIALNLLLNGMCYGAGSLSVELRDRVTGILRLLKDRTGLSCVTTTSPVLAGFVRQSDPCIEIRASVNMEISTVHALNMLASLFDSFYIARALNRDFAAIQRMKAWCDEHGKGLCILANSGCFAPCPVHAFHDNLVAHEAEIRCVENAVEFHGLCRDYLKRPENRESLIANTAFIRPEDVALYEPWFSRMKLATRSNPHPARVLNAYLRGRHTGNLLDLLEPDFSALLYPAILDNSLFPEAFGRQVGTCDRNCQACRYCRDVYRRALVTLF